jgi:Tfp pilus assembly protein PilF
MFLQIASKLPSEVGHRTTEADVPTQAECEQYLAFTGHDHARITLEMLQRLQKPPFTNQVNHSDQVLRLTLKAEGPSESADETAAQYEWAIRKNPADRVLHYNYGLFLFEHNRDAAVQQLSMSRAWDGFPVFTPDGVPVQ